MLTVVVVLPVPFYFVIYEYKYLNKMKSAVKIPQKHKLFQGKADCGRRQGVLVCIMYAVRVIIKIDI